MFDLKKKLYIQQIKGLRGVSMMVFKDHVTVSCNDKYEVVVE